MFSLAGGNIKGRKRLQKMVCILAATREIPFSYQFQAHHFGPYSDELADSLELLTSLGYVKENKEKITDEIALYSYHLTNHGKKTLDLSMKDLGKNNSLFKNLKDGIKELNEKPTMELVQLSKQVSNLY